MILRYLVDTDWAIDHINGKESTVLALERFQPEGVAVSVVTLAELLEGVYSSRDSARSREGVDDFLRAFPVLGVHRGTCEAFGRERGRMRKQKTMIDDFDLLIAATCLHHNLTLLTNNRKHFEYVNGLEILSLP